MKQIIIYYYTVSDPGWPSGSYLPQRKKPCLKLTYKSEARGLDGHVGPCPNKKSWVHHCYYIIINITNFLSTFIFTDWRPLEEADEEMSSSKEESNQIFYEKLKKSVVPKTDLPKGTQNFQQSISHDKKDVLNKIKEITSIITAHKARGIYYYGQLGHELAGYKLLFFNRNKCTKCSLSIDMYSIIKCRICINSANVNKYFQDVSKTTGYGKSYINFLINLGKLCNTFPRLKFTSLTLSEIKSHLRFLPDLMSRETEFWTAD